MWKIWKEPKRMTRKKTTRYKTTFSRDGTNRRLDTAVEKVQLFDDIAKEIAQIKQKRKTKQNEWGVGTYETLLSSLT